MKTRYCGEITLELKHLDSPLGEHILHHRFQVRLFLDDERVWEYDQVLVETNSDIVRESDYDIAAAGAVYFGSKYGIGWDEETEGEIPEWAPDREVAQEINDSAQFDDVGFCIRREIDGPDTYSG